MWASADGGDSWIDRSAGLPGNPLNDIMNKLGVNSRAELAAAEKEANCLVRPSKKSSDLLAVIDETMKDRSKGVAPNCPPAK